MKKIFLLIGSLLISIFTVNAQKNSKVQFKVHNYCNASLKLPLDFSLAPSDDNSSDYCHYEESTKKIEAIKVDALLISRFSLSDIKEFYAAALKTKNIKISYKTQKGNWFVIAGRDSTTNNIIYWKRLVAGEYVYDLLIEYTDAQKYLIEPHLTTIAKSFMVKE